MLQEFREQHLTWDKANRRIHESVKANASDAKGRKLTVQVLNDGVVEDLTGTSLSLFWKTRNEKNKGLDAFDVVDASQGVFELYYTTGMLSNEGKLRANLVLVDDLGRIVSDGFVIDVSPGIDDGAVESSDSFTALTKALVDVQDLEQNYAPRLNEVTAQLAQTETELRKKANQSSLEAEKSRIDNLIGLPDGSTTNDARLEDIKIGTDGTVYNSPGTAVRTQLNEKAYFYNMERVEDFELGYVSAGKDVASTTHARSKVYKLPEGTKISLKRSSGYLLGFNTSDTTTVLHSDGLFYGESLYEATITKEKPYVRFFITRSDGGELNLSEAIEQNVVEIGYKIIYENDGVVFVDDLKDKADKVTAELIKDFELGYVDSNGSEIDSTLHARSPIYNLPEGTKIKLNRSTGYYIGFNTAANQNISHGAGQYYGPTVYETTITKERPYVRFFITRSDGGELNLSEAIEQNIIEVGYNILYENDLDEKIKNLEIPQGSTYARLNNTIDSSFRTPSRAEGGVVTFIDDDGKVGVYTKLYPLFKKHNIPFATAIITSRIGNREDTMTLEQLQELASDSEIVEVLDHGKDHLSLDSTDEKFIHQQVGDSKQWLLDRGFNPTGFVLPYGESNQVSQRIVQQYYNSCYDFANNYAESFDNIRNQLIARDVWTTSAHNANVLTRRKELVDQANLKNEWLIIATHVDNGPTYWDENSEAELEELILYIKAKGMKILSPREGFQTFGNLIENDSGFKIQANGKIVGAK